MTVTVKYNYSVEDGKEFVNFEDWVKTLTEAEQDEFKQAQNAHIIAVGLKTVSKELTVEYTPEMTYTWTTPEAADAGIGDNPLWEKYHNRYLAENNIKLEITKE